MPIARHIPTVSLEPRVPTQAVRHANVAVVFRGVPLAERAAGGVGVGDGGDAGLHPGFVGDFDAGGFIAGHCVDGVRVLC